MVCDRCKSIVIRELDKIGILYDKVELGEVNLKQKIKAVQRAKLYKALKLAGLELIDNKKNTLIEKIKMAIINLGNYSDKDLKTSYSDYIRISVDENFVSLNKLFSEIEGFSIEKYTIKHKIDLVKELLILDDFNIAEIALKLHYRNAAQLSRQFKSITGLTPTHFKQLQKTESINPLSN